MLLHNSNSFDLVTLTPPTVNRLCPGWGLCDGARVEPEHDQGQDRQGAALALAVAGAGAALSASH